MTEGDGNDGLAFLTSKLAFWHSLFRGNDGFGATLPFSYP